MRSSLVLVLVCIGLGCTATEPVASDASPAPEPQVPPKPAAPAKPEAPAEPEIVGPPVGAWVVFDGRGKLLATASHDGARVPGRSYVGPNPELRVAEVVAIAGDFVEVRTIASATARACSVEHGIERDYQLRFFVELEALHPVLPRPKRIELADGTRFELAAGVPVIETGSEDTILVGRTQLIVDLAEQDIGRWFTAPANQQLGTPVLHGLEIEIELHYGERSFVGDWPPFRTAYEQQMVGDHRLLTFADACGRFVLRHILPKPEEGEYAVAYARSLGGNDPLAPEAAAPSCTPRTWKAAAGTELSWANGGQAGVVLVAHELPEYAEERDGRVCFWVSDLDVCIDVAKLEAAGDPECEPRNPLAELEEQIVR
jgi:hypothetical protein